MSYACPKCGNFEFMLPGASEQREPRGKATKLPFGHPDRLVQNVNDKLFNTVAENLRIAEKLLGKPR